MTADPSKLGRLSPVSCAPWCQDGNGHVDALHVDDQYCISNTASVPRSLAKLVEWVSGSWGMDYWTVYLQREYDRTHATVQLGQGDDLTESLTPDEAEQLGRLLIELAEKARVSK